MKSKYTIFDVVQVYNSALTDLTRLLLQFSMYETCFWMNEAILYWCTISRNAFIVGFVGIIHIYMFSKERGNTIYMHNCGVAINVFHKERGNTVQN
jgi:hypothetical protein